ncbi:MAG: UDP-Glc:alpha-D-GlcNAc-diphosphoundecaprenol beta-1,3-glucosyltransferase WfgD [Alphaproteobacteria bacterium MarineAlpha5_Bin11]|nr:hypothetical protein [Pelagibacteraceae bacterium]PPR44961.1 MAG: UDP-Glc:alpha-D-GlcNAc-diphosphoundecaprenol beta-1,3-glucosyltransferase WfgD [Alphaproteobacteria bacterium MarineAlpha5_Bin11]|tara:strand:- start:14976 stop:15788 length:813 start_codon:yes stop_codon:yes gene_type:complete
MYNPSTDIFFSIIICCYNSEKYLKETIESIIEQTHKNWEIVAINDGSTDQTEKILLEYSTKNFPLIYRKQPNRGFAFARNEAIKLSSSEWIVIIDHDDICMPDRLEIHAKQIKQNPNSKLFFGDTIHFNNKNEIIRKNFDIFNFENINLNAGNASVSLLKEGCFIDSESVVFNKHAALRVGNFNTKYKYVADYDFFIKMGRIYEFNYTTQIVSKWRIHDQQATIKLEKEHTNELIRVLSLNILSKSTPVYLKFLLSIRIIKQIIKGIIKK